MGRVARGGSGVLEPRLRLGGVAVRGAAYGAGAAICVTVATFALGEHEDRVDLLDATAFLGLVTGSVLLVTGLFFWACSGGEVLRWRDFFTTRAPDEVVAIAAPSLVRVGLLLLVPVPVALGLGEIVASAARGSWLGGA
ncbi:hypothetical protein CIB93_34565 [Streptomyces sp. WZ.A104]|uniref:DUF6336 family protein n=1 Tax=Streptomyces sp. WZ.A104 TaxID=2023771 RepID=UPI000BBBA6EB|nr:DUF6336 family protein [Streptomyces sp. WZ.A104]PCG81605.1 hypothetical protein CIB93_34565 [Streptomyces sp. WZ.A104]